MAQQETNTEDWRRDGRLRGYQKTDNRDPVLKGAVKNSRGRERQLRISNKVHEPGRDKENNKGAEKCRRDCFWGL